MNKSSPLPLNTEPDDNLTSPKKVEPLSIEVTMNPFSASTDAVTEPLTNIFDVSDTNDSIDCCASDESAENGISLNFSPLPLNAEPLSTLTSPIKVEPLSTEVTINPSSGETEAVTEPLTINDDNNASGVRDAFGISNKLAPLPLKEPVTNLISPKKVEPLSIDVTTRPSSGVTEAVTAPLTIKFDKSASCVNAERGISNKSLPLPLNTEPLPKETPPLTKSDELNSALSVPSNLNPKLGSTDAVTLPLTINDDNNASGVKAAFGILNKSAPLPLNTEPDVNLTSPLKVEPLSTESTINPSSLSTEAVTAPSAILDDCSAAGRLNS